MAAQFIYRGSNKALVDNNKQQILVYGFINSMNFRLFIPDDIKQCIQHFFGRKYKINGPKPSDSELDYVVHLLSPIKMLGINHIMNKISIVSSPFAQKNIICHSDIIQINEEYIGNNKELSVDDIGNLIDAAKQNVPSLLVFRCKKDLNKKGVHLSMDVTLKNENDKFPYFKFEKKNVLKVFESVFASNVEIMEVYANTKCVNGGNGLNILIFVENVNNFYSDLQIKSILDRISEGMNAVMMSEFNVYFVEQLHGIKGNGINCGCSSFGHSEWRLNKRALHSLCYLVKGVDDGQSAWYFVLVDGDKLNDFVTALNKNMIHLDVHGHILDSAYGDEPPENVETMIQNKYKFYTS